LNQNITLKAISNKLNVSERHLNRICKQHFSKTVFQILQDIRIDKSKFFLKHTDEKVITIANNIGYDDPFVK
jgi:AraC-like DNA-binding protein